MHDEGFCTERLQPGGLLVGKAELRKAGIHSSAGTIHADLVREHWGNWPQHSWLQLPFIVAPPRYSFALSICPAAEHTVVT